MKTLLIMTAACAMSGKFLFADCSRISETNALYKSVMQSTASLRDIKRLQQMVGVRADGVWGQRSDRAYEELVLSLIHI